jgi:hypothetical protein
MRLAFVVALFAVCLPAAEVVTSPSPAAREQYAAERLRSLPFDGSIILALDPALHTPESFRIHRAGNTIRITGADPSGLLYGALELEHRFPLPADFDFSDHPVMTLRGTCIGMQKTEITYEGAIYDYPYTPENFPFFYDRALWIRYLDFLAENRYNTLYLWNGHPFTSLLKLPKYPEAQELPTATLDRNIEMFRWLATEADRRGIWLIQGFYNIHLSHAFARAHGTPFHLAAPTQLASEYTRYAIAEFIKAYPNVGLMMTLGEALAPRNGAEWLTKTIIPGVLDSGRKPPIIVRAHATDIDAAIHQALPLYPNIFTMHKWNGESLTWTDIRGGVLELHEKLVALGSQHIANVHLLSNLEPFRWGSPEYVQETVHNMVRHGIRGLHLYPLRYWEWPVSADNTKPLLLQMDRDWIWFETWARYAWNPERDRTAEREYWIGRFAEKYGTRQAGAALLDAYQFAGVCAPRLLPRIGITEGNRQAFTLGMLMPQLINPVRYSALELLWTGDGPPGERLDEWVRKEAAHEPHVGETPIQTAHEVVASAAKAVAAAESAKPTRDLEEYQRVVNDMRAIHAMMRYYELKTEAAAAVLQYDFKRAEPLLRASVEEFRRLVSLTDKTYREACSVHSNSRRIPFLGAPGRYTHWRDTLPEYEKELVTFVARTSGLPEAGETARAAWPAVAFQLNTADAQTFRVQPGATIYTGAKTAITAIAPELADLSGIRLPQAGGRVEFTLAQPAQVLVAFFHSPRRNVAAAPPKDEWNPVLFNGITAADHPAFTVYAHELPTGRNELDFGSGGYVVLGFVRQNARLDPRVIVAPGAPPDLDSLFQ